VGIGFGGSRRLIAEWWVRSSRVENAVSGSMPLRKDSPVGRIAIPANIRELCQAQPEEAADIQSRAHTRFEELMSCGYAATGFELSEGEGAYILGPYED
jgi:predicted GNAT superfamily acetyltransferase